MFLTRFLKDFSPSSSSSTHCTILQYFTVNLTRSCVESHNKHWNNLVFFFPSSDPPIPDWQSMKGAVSLFIGGGSISSRAAVLFLGRVCTFTWNSCYTLRSRVQWDICLYTALGRVTRQTGLYWILGLRWWSRWDKFGRGNLLPVQQRSAIRLLNHSVFDMTIEEINKAVALDTERSVKAWNGT